MADFIMFAYCSPMGYDVCEVIGQWRNGNFDLIGLDEFWSKERDFSSCELLAVVFD
jgi:hypothetical protein